MADPEQQTNDQGERSAMDADNKSKKESKRRAAGQSQEVIRYNGQAIDEMKIVDLKDALRKLNRSTTGNKMN